MSSNAPQGKNEDGDATERFYWNVFESIFTQDIPKKIYSRFAANFYWLMVAWGKEGVWGRSPGEMKEARETTSHIPQIAKLGGGRQGRERENETKKNRNYRAGIEGAAPRR